MLETPTSATSPAPPVAQPLVLIVDDVPVDLHKAGALVQESLGWRVALADHGAHALESIARAMPAVVLTDLLMPDMDGLQLVEAVRRDYPFLPVVLMTAHGSEEVASRALRQGAASYVPKRSLAQDLAETLEKVVAAAQAGRSHRQLLGCMQEAQMQFALENEPTLVNALTAFLQEALHGMAACDETESIRTSIALTEALSNALYHGNLEISSQLRQIEDDPYYELARKRARRSPYAERRIHVTARLSRPESIFTIRDEGPGFDPTRLPDPTDPANLESRTGRGLLLVRTFMDEVTHNATGNQITMVKRHAKP